LTSKEPAAGRGELPRVTRLAAYAVVRRDGRRLLCRIAPGYPAAGRWTLPGGGVEFGEDPARAVIREIEEETGLVGRLAGPVRVLSDSGVWQRSDGPVRYHHVRFVYPVEIVGGEERLERDGSTDAFGWFSEHDIAGLERTGVVDEAVAE
jgi:ADP-ribose pyrophosphatase YjhB (NUDIX family)